ASSSAPVFFPNQRTTEITENTEKRNRKWANQARAETRTTDSQIHSECNFGLRFSVLSVVNLLAYLARHLKQVQESAIHDAFAGAELDGAHLGAGAVAALGDRLDGGKVLLIVVAVAEEEQVLEPGALFQPEGVIAEELAADTDQPDLAGHEGRRQVRPHALAIFTLVEVHELLEEGEVKGGAHQRIAE